MTPNQEFIKHILCLHCKHNLELSKGQIGDGDEFAALVRCGRDGWYNISEQNVLVTKQTV